MWEVRSAKSFRKSFKKFEKNKKIQDALEECVGVLMKGCTLHAKYKNHKLKGNMKGYFECHLFPDVLLVYFLDSKQKKVYLQDIGSHSELFS